MSKGWRREDIPYDAMGDYSVFDFEKDENEEKSCEDQDNPEARKTESP